MMFFRAINWKKLLIASLIEDHARRPQYFFDQIY